MGAGLEAGTGNGPALLSDEPGAALFPAHAPSRSERVRRLPIPPASIPPVILEVDGKGAPLAGVAFHRHFAPVGLGNVLDDGQPEASAPDFAAAAGVHPVEAFEEPGQVLFGDAHPLVRDFYRHLAVFRTGFYLN
jgi:hypothetical protein